MCARFGTVLKVEDFVEHFGVQPEQDSVDLPELCPTDQVPVVRRSRETGDRKLDFMRFGLVPYWADDLKIGTKLLNARAETLAEKPAFRDAYQSRRCIVPASFYFEWNEGQKYQVQRADGAPMGLAALWERWKAPDDQWVRSCAIITTAPNELISTVHDRMPAILEPDDYALWISEAGEVPPGLLAPIAADSLQLVAVGDPKPVKGKAKQSALPLF